MKQLLSLLLLSFHLQLLSAQVSTPFAKLSTIDSLKNELNTTSNDTLRLVLANELRFNYFFKMANFDSTLTYSKLIFTLAQKLHLKIDEAYALDLIGDVLNYQHNPNTLQTFFDGVKIAEVQASENNILPPKYLAMITYWNADFKTLLIRNNWSPNFFRLQVLGSLYQDLGHAYGKVMPNQQRLFYYLSKAIEIYKTQKDTGGLAVTYNNIAEYFSSTDQFDSSLLYALKADELQRSYLGKPDVLTLAIIGTMHFKKGNDLLAVKELRQSIEMGLNDQQIGNWLAYFTFSEYFFKTGYIDSSLYYAKEAHKITKEINMPEEIQKTSAMLAKLYRKKGDPDSALSYFELSLSLSESLNNADKKRKLQSQDFEEQLHRQELQDEKAKLKVYILLGGVGSLLIVAFFLLKNNQQRKKTNAVLLNKNQEIESTLTELKATQSQLIQSEKMASLGELTAGIAHEIQNPLNFVNNFSEVNKELVDELQQELKAGKIDDAIAISNDIKDNEEKINHHGKRADAIVKGMLQHSQSSTGQKEPADINKLADKYLRLSYHGFLAKDNTFNATLIPIAIGTDYDESIGSINIIPQDIGRVLLNLYNNAFYAVSQKQKAESKEYEPTVSVSTKMIKEKVVISVRDNGNGIPQKIVDKIFQPFFTTKPTGQGTGLGLSLSYDIIKAHGGEIKVECKEGEGAEFIIQLPVSKTLEI